MTGDTEVDLASMTSADWRLAMSFYSSGYTHGVSDGRDGMRAEMGAEHAHLAAAIRRSAGERSHEDRADRRRLHQGQAAAATAAAALPWAEEVA